MAAEGDWLMRLPQRALRGVARLRDIEGMEIAFPDGERGAFWLRADIAAEDASWRRLNALDADFGGRRLGDDGLAPHGCRVPVEGVPPDLEWAPLGAALELLLPDPEIVAGEIGQVGVRLVPSAEVTPAQLLACSLDDLGDWGLDTASARLAPLRFAASNGGEALVQGSPLPPISGERFVFKGGVACPIGTGWSPPVCPASLCLSASVPAGDLLLLRHDRPALHLPAELFVPLDHAALRATMAGGSL